MMKLLRTPYKTDRFDYNTVNLDINRANIVPMNV